MLNLQENVSFSSRLKKIDFLWEAVNRRLNVFSADLEVVVVFFFNNYYIWWLHWKDYFKISILETVKQL